MVKKLNFGCGNDIKEGWDNVDIQENKKIYKSFDFNEIPYPLKDDSYDHILMKQVIEHLLEPAKVLKELHRICKKNGTIHIETAYYNNKGAYNDLEHFHYFSEQTFIHFVENTTRINKKKLFEITYLELKPTKVGKIFPRKLREKLSLFLGGLISQIHVDLKVLKL